MPDTYFSFDEAQAQPDTPSDSYFSFDDVAPKPEPAPDKTLGSQLAVKIPEVMSDFGIEFQNKVPGIAQEDLESLNRVKQRVVLEEAKKRITESPIKPIMRGAQQALVGAAESMQDPENLGLIAAGAVYPPAVLPVMSGLAAKAVGQGAGTLSVPGGANLSDATREIINMGLMTAGAVGSAKAATDFETLAKSQTVLPNATREATQSIIQKGLQDASKVGETETVHGDVSAQPEQGVREVPPEVSSEGVQPQAQAQQAGQVRVLLDKPKSDLENVGFAAANTPEGKSEYTPAVRKSDGTILTGKSHGKIPGRGGIPGYVDKNGTFLTLTDVARKEMQKTDKGVGASGIPSGDVQLTVIPGLKEFMEQDIVPKTIEGANAIAESAKGAESLLSPPTKSESARLAGGIIRERAAELAQKDYRARKDFAKARSQVASWKPNESLQFITKIETGSTSALSPEMQRVSGGLRQALNDRVRDVRALGTGKLNHVIEDYFPHMWKQPGAASQLFAKIFGKRPLMGPKSFLKKRTIPLTMDGVAAGLEPVTWNPVDLTLLKLHEMDRYVMGQKIMQEFKQQGLATFSRSDVPPPGYGKINDSVANVIEYRPTKTASGSPGAPERVLRGHWYAQEDAARVLNNYLSPGLGKFAWYRALRWFGNNLNMANLGLSGYHLTFTMIDSGTSKLSLGIEQAAQGKLKGVPTILRGVAGTLAANQLEAYYKGNKVLREYSKPGSVGGEYTKVVDALLAGGGRVEMPQIFQNSTIKNFFDAAKSGNYPGAVLRAPFAAIHAVSYPLMNVVVPRLKLGIFSDMARHEIERMGPGVTREQFRKTMGKVWDSVDNRMGELVYDNLFWNKTLKDLSFLAVRSVGWNLGTVRELGGAVVDSANIIKRLKNGEPAVTRKMAYAVALPITVGMMGAIYQKLRTGQSPQEAKDYFYPKTGNTLPNGEPERVSFPSYLKDVVSFKRHPVQTVINKAHPSIGMVANMLQNKDYYGTEVIHPDDPLVQKAKDELSFVAKSFRPYSFQGAQKRTDIEPGAEPAVESFFGIMPMPAELTRTPAENLAIELMRDQMPKGSRTKEQAARVDSERKAIGQMKMGKMSIADAVKQGLVSENRADAVEQRAMMPYLEYAVSRLNARSAMKVFEAATPKERELILDRVDAKIDNSTSLSEEDRDALRQRLNDLQKK